MGEATRLVNRNAKTSLKIDATIEGLITKMDPIIRNKENSSEVDFFLKHTRELRAAMIAGKNDDEVLLDFGGFAMAFYVAISPKGIHWTVGENQHTFHDDVDLEIAISRALPRLCAKGVPVNFLKLYDTRLA